MDKKMIIAVAVVAVVVAAAGAVAFTVMNNNKDNGSDYTELRLVVYGNANNDNYLDSKDVDLVKSIADSGSWDKEKYPFADANNDGKVDSADVDTVKGFLDGKQSLMYYKNWSGGVSKVHYPVTGKISVSYDIALDIAILSGWYDQIGYMNVTQANIDKISTDSYPGADKIKTVGTYPYDFETVYSKDDLVLVTGDNYNYDETFMNQMDAAQETGKTKDYLLLPFARCVNGMDCNTTIVTMGVMTMHQDVTKKYIEYIENIDKTVHAKLNEMGNNLSCLIFYRVDGNDAFTLRVPNNSGFHHSNVYMIQSLGFTNAAGSSNNGGVKCGIEQIIGYDADVIFVINTGWVNEDLTDSQFHDKVRDMMGYLEQTRAYKEGKVYYVGFELIGSAPGYATVPVLMSFIWPDVFDEETGWNTLQSFYKDYLNRDIDVRNSHLAPLRMSDVGLSPA